MIHSCSCSGGSASPVELLKLREVPKSCKNCGGRQVVNEQAPISGSMLGNVELSRAIDPHLNWRTASRVKSRARAPRRARTSFGVGDKKRAADRYLKEGKGVADKDLKTGEMSVSESEKLGVTILGRRFGESIESVPIKKRRFLLLQPPSPPQHSLSLTSDQSECLLARQGGIAQQLNGKQQLQQSSSDNIWEANNIPSDGADFSGISILAAAACNSRVGVLENSEPSVTKEQEIGSSCGVVETLQSHDVLDNKIVERQPNVAGVPEDKSEIPGSSASSREGDDGNIGGVTHISEEQTSLNNGNETLAKDWSCSREDRFHWDLNKAIDVWGDQETNVVDDLHDDKPNKPEVCTDQARLEGTKWPTEQGGGFLLETKPNNNSERHAISEVPEKLDSSGKCTIVDDSTGRDCLSVACDDSIAQKDAHFASDDMVEVAEETKDSNNEGHASLGTGAVSSRAGHTPDRSPETNKFEEDANPPCLNLGSREETGASSSQKILTGSTCMESASGQLEPQPMVGQFASEVVSQDTEHPSTVSLLNKHSNDSLQVVSQSEPAVCTGSSEEEKHASPHNDMWSAKTKSLTDDLVTDEVSGILVSRNGVKRVHGGAESGCEVAQGEPTENSCSAVCQSKETIENPHTSGSYCFRTQGSSAHEELDFASNYASKEGEETTEANVQGHTTSTLTDGSASPTKIEHHVPNETKGPRNDSINVVPAVLGQTPVDSASPSDACKIPADANVKCLGDDALDHFDCDYDSDASQNDTEQPGEMEKVELHGDDDSQYEDGEFRESVLNIWGIDGGEDGEAEPVDYGSDNRESDVFGSPGLASAGPLHTDSTEYGNEKPQVGAHIRPDEDQIRKEMADNVSKHHSRNLNMEKDERKTSVVKRVTREHDRRKDGRDKLHRGINDDASVTGVGRKLIRGGEHFTEGGDGAKESGLSASLKMKSSGWDRLPEGSKVPRDAILDVGYDSSTRSNTGNQDKYVSDSRRRVSRSTPRKDLSSQIERPKSSETSHRKNETYFWGSRSDNPDDPNTVERGGGRIMSSGRGGSSVHKHERSRRGGDGWEESNSQWGPTRHESPGHYLASFSHSSSKNAAEAAAAKVESNGFVVAPDGTIVEPNDIDSTGRASRQSANVFLQTAHRSLIGRVSPSERDEVLNFSRQSDYMPMREMSPSRRHLTAGHGRPGRCGSRMVSTGHRERYNGAVPSDSMESLPIRRPFSRRERNFSPQRGSLHILGSRTKSRSRSRTRSPHMWTSPRRKNDSGVNGEPGFRRWSRSPPNFRSDARGERTRSPHRRPGFLERMTDFAPSSRGHVSPPHSSRWIDERKDFEDHFREPDYRRSSGRSPPGRLFSRNHRFDVMDNGRMKAEEYPRPMHPGRFREFGVGRRPRFDGGNERRGHGNRYQILTSPSSGQYELGDMKGLQYDVDNGFRPNNSRYKNGPEFDGRGSSRGFDRGIESQLESSPRRSRDEEGHFRYGREVRHNGNFRSFRNRECNEDGTPQRRPS